MSTYLCVNLLVFLFVTHTRVHAHTHTHTHTHGSPYYIIHVIRVTKDLVRRKRHYASKLEELDRRVRTETCMLYCVWCVGHGTPTPQIALQATPVLEDEGQAPDKHGETERRTKLVEKAREIVQRVRLDTGSTEGDQEMDIGHDLRGLKTAVGDLISDDNVGRLAAVCIDPIYPVSCGLFSWMLL